MDKVILTSYTIEELASILIEKLSPIYNRTVETHSNDWFTDDKKYLTPKETAKLCNISSLSTLWNWKKKGLLIPIASAGKNPRYLRQDVLDFLTRNIKTEKPLI